MLRADIDALFDAGYISFDDEGRLLMSAQPPPAAAQQLGLVEAQPLAPQALSEQGRRNLAYHRQHVFGSQPPSKR